MRPCSYCKLEVKDEDLAKVFKENVLQRLVCMDCVIKAVDKALEKDTISTLPDPKESYV